MNTGQLDPGTGHLSANTGQLDPDTGHLDADTGHLSVNTGHLDSDTGQLGPDIGHLSELLAEGFFSSFMDATNHLRYTLQNSLLL